MASDSPAKQEPWQADEDFEEYEVKEVELDRDEGERGTWVAKLEFDFVLRWPRGGKSPQPKVGQTCRVFGDIDGKWGPRGIVIAEKIAFFRTPEDQVKWVELQEDQVYIEAKLLFSIKEKELQARMKLLPEKLSTRVEAAREAADDKERFDVYELEVEIVKHEHGHMVALVVDGLPTLETFSMIPSQPQMSYSWNAMCDGRRQVIKKMLGQEIDPEEIIQHYDEEDQKEVSVVDNEEVRTKLREDLAFLDRYQEQRFIVNHPSDVLSEIFVVAGELLAAEIQH